MSNQKHRADILQEYIDSGLEPVAAIAKLKTEHPEFWPKHRSAEGEPLTFEGVVTDNIRKHGMRPDVAIRAASTSEPRMQRDYYDRLRIGAATNLEIIEGHPV